MRSRLRRSLDRAKASGAAQLALVERTPRAPLRSSNSARLNPRSLLFYLGARTGDGGGMRSDAGKIAMADRRPFVLSLQKGRCAAAGYPPAYPLRVMSNHERHSVLTRIAIDAVHFIHRILHSFSARRAPDRFYSYPRAHRPPPLCAAEDGSQTGGGLGEHCSNPERRSREVELRSPACLRPVEGMYGAPGSAFFDYFLCTSKESDQLPGCPRRGAWHNARPIRRVKKPKTQSPSVPLLQRGMPSMASSAPTSANATPQIEDHNG